jgi:hypothetical protein
VISLTQGFLYMFVKSGCMFRYILFLLLGVFQVAHASENTVSKPAIVFDNRVLATVRDQIITVYDVVKKLDMLFYQNYPEHKNNLEARFDFYRAHWRKMVEDLVDRQLVLSWAEEKQFQVSNGDIRQELEEVFGPEVMMNLYETGFTLHEVQEMIRADILLRRIIYFYVRLPVSATITPKRVKEAYYNKVKEMQDAELICWKSVTVKTKDGNRAIVDTVRALFQNEHLSLEDVQKKVPEGVEVSVSPLFRSEKREISPSILSILEKLSCGAYSEPFSGKGDNWRFYCVESREKKEVPSFAEVEEAVRDELAYPEIEKKTKLFFDDLRRQYHVKQLFSSEQLLAFDPFTIRLEGASA